MGAMASQITTIVCSTRLFMRRSKETPKLCVTGLCTGNSPVTGEFPAQMAINAENVSIWWRHHEYCRLYKSYAASGICIFRYSQCDGVNVLECHHPCRLYVSLSIGPYSSNRLSTDTEMPFWQLAVQTKQNILHLMTFQFKCHYSNLWQYSVIWDPLVSCVIGRIICRYQITEP